MASSAAAGITSHAPPDAGKTGKDEPEEDAGELVFPSEFERVSGYDAIYI